jgi:hypothetical protein
MATWTTRLKTLRVRKQQEHGSIFVAAGDEPYLVMLGYRSRIATPGSTKVWVNKYENDTWAKDIEKGETKKVPQGMGTCTFEDVHVTSLDDVAASRFPELIGCVVLAIESDGTGWGAVSKVVSRTKSALKKEIASLVERLNVYPLNPKEELQHVVERVKNVAIPPVLEGVVVWFTSGFDFDDPVGAHVMVFACVDATLGGLVPTETTKSVTISVLREFDPLKLRFKGDKAEYEVTASFTTS